MTSRRIRRKSGSVVSQVRRHKHTGGVRTSGTDKPLTPRERQRLIQLVVCAGVFVLLVAVKLLLPERMAQVNQRLADALQKNMDVQSVFSAVGRAFSGQSDLDGAAQEVYRAVFAPETEMAQETAAPAGEIYETAMDALRVYHQETEEGEQAGSSVSEQTEVSTLAYVRYSDENLPEDVTMEQAILGFDYCTPVSGVISSDFGYREHPVEGEERFHYGVDLAADRHADRQLCGGDGQRGRGEQQLRKVLYCGARRRDLYLICPLQPDHSLLRCRRGARREDRRGGRDRHGHRSASAL